MPAPSGAGTSSSVIYYGSDTYMVGLALNDNKGNPDSRGASVRSTNAPQSAASGFNSGNYTLTGYYPYYWGVSGSQLTASQIITLIQTGSLGTDYHKVIANASGTLSINFAASSQYPWFAIFSPYTTKVSWADSSNPLNSGTIGGVTDLFLGPTTLALNSPDGYWSSKNYKVYSPGKITTLAGANIS